MNKLPKFWIMSSDDENIELFVGKKSVGSFNHDEHGWNGMTDAKKLFEKTAKALGAEFERK